MGHIWSYVAFKVYLENRTILSMFLSRGEDIRKQMESVVKNADVLKTYNVPGSIFRTLHMLYHLILTTT
mgnify:CR=1 FL=1